MTKHMTYAKPHYIAVVTALLFASTGCDTDGDLGKNTTEDAASSGGGTGGQSSGSNSSTGGTAGQTTESGSGVTTDGTATGPGPSTTTEATQTGTTTGPESSGDTESTGGMPVYAECLEPQLMPYLDSLGPACLEFLVIEYTFQEQSVFVFDSSQCGFFDQFFPVFTQDCKILCNLYGLVGSTECNGEEFYANAVELDSWPYPG